MRPSGLPGAPDGKARDAAVEIATYENGPANIEADVRLLKWMVGLVLAGVLSLVVKTFLLNNPFPLMHSPRRCPLSQGFTDAILKPF